MPEGLRNFLRYVFNNPHIEYAFYVVAFIGLFYLMRRFFLGG